MCKAQVLCLSSRSQPGIKGHIYSIALRTAKTLWSFGHYECNRVKWPSGLGAIVTCCNISCFLYFFAQTYQDRMLYSSIKGQKFDDGCTFQYYCPADQCIYKKESNRYFVSFKLLKQVWVAVPYLSAYKTGFLAL